MKRIQLAVRCTLLLAFALLAAPLAAHPWSRPALLLSREEARVDWQDRRGHRSEAPHGARGDLIVTDADGGVVRFPLRLIAFAKWQPDPSHLVTRVRFARLGPYPLRLRLELRWTFQRTGPEVLEFTLDRPDGKLVPLSPAATAGVAPAGVTVRSSM